MYYIVKMVKKTLHKLGRPKKTHRNYLGFGVDGVSLSAFDIKLKITTTKQSKIGPNIAPSHPNRNMPPAIDRPVK